MKRLFKEPLLHFLLLGAAIFVVFNSVSQGDASERGAIVVTQARIESLEEKFSRTWQRPPSAEELDALIQDFVREEAAVREAAALGMDRDDTAIRRLLRQRLELVTEDMAGAAEPTAADLRDYLRDHAEDFRTEARISFTHIFLDPRRRGTALAADAARLRARLNTAGGQVDVAELGDATLLERQFTALPLSMAAQMFGASFADALRTEKPGRWSAPIASAYGQHLVFVSDITPGAVPALDEVRETVRREWVNARRRAALDELYRALLQRYRVIVEMPQANKADTRLAGLR